MEHRDIRQVLHETVLALLEESGSGGWALPYALRPYQREAFGSMGNWLEDKSGTHRSYVAHATGLGKTIEFAMLIAHMPPGRRVLITVPTKVLLEQTARVIVECTGGIIGQISSIRKVYSRDGKIVAVYGFHDSEIVITTNASFITGGGLLRDVFKPDVVIVDECHWSYRYPFQDMLASFKDAVIMAYSATPDYLTTNQREGFERAVLPNGATLWAPPDRLARVHYETCLDQRSVQWGHAQKWLAPFTVVPFEIDVSLDNIPVVDGFAGPDYHQTRLLKVLRERWPVVVEAVCALYEENRYNVRDEQVSAVCPGVQEAQQLAEAVSRFVPSACLIGDLDSTERNEVLERFSSKETRFVSSVRLLREGWNAPEARIGLMFQPARAYVFFMQCVGRFLRLDELDPFKHALILEGRFHDSQKTALSARMLFDSAEAHSEQRALFEHMAGRQADRALYVFTGTTVGGNGRPGGVSECAHLAEDATQLWLTIPQCGRRLGIPAGDILKLVAEKKYVVRERKLEADGSVLYVYAFKDVQQACVQQAQEG